MNMEQTLIKFLYHSNKMLDAKGTKTIHTRMSKSDTKCVTLVATVTASASRNMLPPYHIFKGQSNGCIALQEFSMFPAAGNMHAGTRRGWMKEGYMIGSMLFCICGKKSEIWTNHACSHPSWSWMHTTYNRWVWSLTKSSQWGLRCSTSWVGAHTCVSELMWESTNPSKMDYMICGISGWWKEREL